MPMFAFLSGYFLKKSCEKHKFSENILNRIGTILIPILVWNVIFSVLQRWISIERFWFLWSLFFCNVIVFCIDKIFRFNKTIMIIAFAAIIIAFHMFNAHFNIGFLLFPCIVGYFFEQIKLNVNKRFSNLFYAKAFIVGAFVIMQCFWKTDYTVWNTGCDIFAFGTPIKTSAKIIFRGLIGITGCIVMKMLFGVIYTALESSKYPQMQKILQKGVTVGKYTMELYILQSYFVEVLGGAVVRKITEIIGGNPFVYNSYLLGYVFAPIIAVISIIILYLLQKYIKKIPVIGKYTFGFPISKIFGVKNNAQ